MARSVFEKFPMLKEIPTEKFPAHICIIPDGNGRWAKKHGKFVTYGHKKGFEAAYSILEMLAEIPEIKIATIWGFSADNWKRSEKEVAGLMLLFEHIIQKTLKDLMKRNGRFVHIGRKDRIPERLRKLIDNAEQQTKNHTQQIVCLAIDFGGEDQEVRLLEKARMLPTERAVDERLLWELRDGAGVVKSADLLIRTSGEQRTSDIGWLSGINTELYFTPKLFPDMTHADIVEAILDFCQRERRFGGRAS